MAAIVIRPAAAAEVADVARVWQEGWADAHLGNVPRELVEARTADWFQHRARERLDGTIVAAVADAPTIVGFAIVEDDQVDQLHLARAARGRGVGAALLAAAEVAVLAAGHRRAWLAVATGNTAARRFYERQGWIDVGAFVHQAPVPGGSVPVDCHRFVSPR
ncbi:GNAT family N-acetyltransferase [Agromyces endophyticus]|uniref:GNAT family N-acetyltransferase n=1 Tax=Agromyces sp. H17E-10 TaxID=2932244 RepID=UPI001FD11A3E|nr:GNAT family N-acetyltransferase [Agromyces sp. H17E-10]UOQ90510.1 GNAT family N-acetyltransferase [Agromyces sp. H17E-10]